MLIEGKGVQREGSLRQRGRRARGEGNAPGGDRTPVARSGVTMAHGARRTMARRKKDSAKRGVEIVTDARRSALYDLLSCQ